MPIVQSCKKNSIKNNNINRDRERKKSMRRTKKILNGGWVWKVLGSKRSKPFGGDGNNKQKGVFDIFNKKIENNPTTDTMQGNLPKTTKAMRMTLRLPLKPSEQQRLEKKISAEVFKIKSNVSLYSNTKNNKIKKVTNILTNKAYRNRETQQAQQREYNTFSEAMAKLRNASRHELNNNLQRSPSNNSYRIQKLRETWNVKQAEKKEKQETQAANNEREAAQKALLEQQAANNKRKQLQALNLQLMPIHQEIIDAIMTQKIQQIESDVSLNTKEKEQQIKKAKILHTNAIKLVQAAITEKRAQQEANSESEAAHIAQTNPSEINKEVPVQPLYINQIMFENLLNQQQEQNKMSHSSNTTITTMRQQPALPPKNKWRRDLHIHSIAENRSKIPKNNTPKISAPQNMIMPNIEDIYPIGKKTT